ncbi:MULTISPECIES: hypothetical protein [Mycobacterium]|nr:MULTISPECIES: hypothetical protein [Mycobacterium]MDM4141916.1 hypothetical protein [Mycobacterium sp. FLAC0960]
MEIDHLIPQKTSEIRLQELLQEHLTTAERELPFDIHAPHNLGPICGPCNGEKSNGDFTSAPRMMSVLRKARRLERRVIQAVEKFHSGKAFNSAMSTVTGFDQTNDDVMETLSELGPALINRLRHIVPQILEGPSNYDFSDPDGDAMDDYLVTVTLDETSRRARVLLEDAYSCDFDAALVTTVRAVIDEIRAQLRRLIEHALEERGYGPDVGPVQARIDVAVNGLTVDPGGPQFELHGSYEGEGTAEAAIQNPRNDSGTSWVQRDAEDKGHFTAGFFPDDAPDVVVDYVDLS